ncbi:MAG: LPS-assembly protein LptD [Bacteroidetes bacterium]|nr:LPS-assembly protein LptD [Bacteroidota bacterium]
MGTIRFLKYILLLILLWQSYVFAQEPVQKSSISIRQAKSPLPSPGEAKKPVKDLLAVSKKDSIASDSLKLQTKGDDFDAEVEYKADGKITINNTANKIYMYKNGQVKYKDIELTADYIELNRDSNLIHATGKPDSTGAIVGKPVFKQGQQEFEADEIRYNFLTKKGIVYGVVTEQEGGFIQSGKTKLMNDSTYNMKDGKYTTCDAEHPHFYLQMTKAKVLSNKKIVTGPAYLVVEDLPIYFLFIPFGFFPNSPKYSSGFLMPTYGDEINRGFFLRDMGYYWAANDYFDLALRGDIFSKGSRGIKMHTNYRLRYKFSGGLDINFYKNVFGDKGLPDYKIQNDFAITWNHSMDSKASPNQTFSASVNFSTSQYDQNNSYSLQNYLTNTKQSSISYSRRWENTPFAMSANFRHSQNSRDTTINLTLPQMTFSVNRMYPFKSKNSSGKEKWYEKIGMSYNFDMQNSINTKEYKLFGSNLTKDWQNGIKQSIPISTSFKALKFITVSPSFNYNERWYTQQIRKAFDPVKKMVVTTDTIFGFTRDFDYSVSVGASTKIYGDFMPRNPKSNIVGIRHVMTPSISFSMQPDFSNPGYGMYGNIEYFDDKGRPVSLRYPYHEGAIYGTAGAGRSGSIGLNLNNTLEMKMLNRSDTTSKEKYKKIKLLDQFSISSSYNLAADSLNLSNINITARTKVAGIDVNMGAIMDPYAYENGHLINVFEFAKTKKLARLTSANMSFGYSFKSKSKEEENQKTAAAAGTDGKPAEKSEDQKIIDNARKNYPDIPEYADFSIPWDFRFDYSLRYSKPNPVANPSVNQTVEFNGNISLTKNWQIGFSSGLDIQKMEVSFTQFNVFRDMHCFQMSLNLVPFGYRQSYSFTIRATAAMLQDLKLSKQESFYDKQQY